MNDSWDQGAAYEQYMGRWSRLVAREFLAWLGIAPGSRWLDVGCGTGVLSRAILEQADAAQVTALDLSEDFVAYGGGHQSNGPLRFRFMVGTAQQLPARNQCKDAVVSGLALNFFPDPLAAVREMARVTRPGGTVAAYVWDYAGQMQMLRMFWDSVVSLDSGAADRDEGTRFPLCGRAPLLDLFHSAELHGAEVRAIDVVTRFRSFEDYWSPFLSGQGPAPGYVMSLSERARAELRHEVKTRLAAGSDGSIRLVARAWAVRCVRPPHDPA